MNGHVSEADTPRYAEIAAFTDLQDTQGDVCHFWYDHNPVGYDDVGQDALPKDQVEDHWFGENGFVPIPCDNFTGEDTIHQAQNTYFTEEGHWLGNAYSQSLQSAPTEYGAVAHISNIPAWSARVKRKAPDDEEDEFAAKRPCSTAVSSFTGHQPLWHSRLTQVVGYPTWDDTAQRVFTGQYPLGSDQQVWDAASIPASTPQTTNTLLETMLYVPTIAERVRIPKFLRRCEGCDQSVG